MDSGQLNNPGSHKALRSVIPKGLLPHPQVKNQHSKPDNGENTLD